MTEDDWPVLLRWNSDPEVLYFSEGADVNSYDLAEIQEIYRGVSHQAYCFIAEIDARPVGEGWLQRMNLSRILERYPGKDCRRIDLMIGEKTLWGQGIGSEMIRLLVAFVFNAEKADIVFGCGIADYNRRSLRAFQKAGFQLAQTIAEEPGSKAQYVHDLILTRERFTSLRQREAPQTECNPKARQKRRIE